MFGKTVSFNIPQNGDLLMNTYFTVKLPMLNDPKYYFNSYDFLSELKINRQHIVNKWNNGVYKPLLAYCIQCIWVEDIIFDYITEVEVDPNSELYSDDTDTEYETDYDSDNSYYSGLFD